MAAGIGVLRRKAMMDWLSGAAAATSPSGAWSLGLWVGDPGEDGQSGAEVTGTGYARGTVAATTTGWTATTSATPAVLANAQAISIGTAATSWTASITHVALWTASGTTAANFIARANITGAPVTVPNGVTVSIAIAGLTLSLTST